VRRFKPVEQIDPVLMAKAVLIRRELEDPLLHYKPSPTQALFHHRTNRYTLVNAPTRAGKTACSAMDLAMCARRKHATKTVTCVNGTYLVFGTSREALRDNWYGKLRVASNLRGPAEKHPMIPSWEVFSEKFSGSGADRTIKEIVMRHPDDPNKPGHRLLFAISGDPKTWRRLEGKDRVLGIYFDEVEGSRELFTECFRRVLETNAHEEIKAEAGGGFISWSGTETKENEVFKEWMAKCEEPEQYPEYRLFKLSPSETGAISDEERQKMSMNLSKEDYDISMLGKGRYADRLLIYGRQLDPKRHLLETDYEPQPEDNLWVVYDPGFDHKTGIAVVAIRPSKPNKLHFVRAWFHAKTTMGQDISVLRQYLRGRFIECFVADPASHKTEKGSGKKLITQIREELVRAGIKSMRGFRMPYNRHAPGIYDVRRFLDPVPGNPNAEPLLCFNSSRESGCMQMWTGLCAYKSHKEGQFQGTHGVVKKDDEAADLTRYIVCCTDRSPWSSWNAHESPSMMRPTWVKRPPNKPLWDADATPTTYREVTEVVLTEEEILNKERTRKSALAAHIRSRGGKRLRRSRFVEAAFDEE
jgi:hypothetical protein